MDNDKIIELAERYGWFENDNHGPVWVMGEDALLDFAKAVFEAEFERRALLKSRVDWDGARRWYYNGEPHRLDGPAVIWPDGTTEWRREGSLHREDGPAITLADGSTFWYNIGFLHRVDGPAVEWADGTKEYWYMGKSQEDETEIP